MYFLLTFRYSRFKRVKGEKIVFQINSIGSSKCALWFIILLIYLLTMLFIIMYDL
jgi:hypothetical protein